MKLKFFPLLFGALSLLIVGRGAMAYVDYEAAQGKLNRSSTVGPSILMGDLETINKPQALRCVWTYGATGQSGAVESENLHTHDGADCLIPKGAVITKSRIHVITALVSGGSATLALNVNTAGDLLGATAVASFSLDALLSTLLRPTVTVTVSPSPIPAVSPWVLGYPATVTYTDVSPIRVSAVGGKTVQVTIATATITAGKFEAFIEFYLGR